MLKRYFLSGLPRTGSTLLGAILSQNPLIHVTPTSPLLPALIGTVHLYATLGAQHTFECESVRNHILRETIDAVHSNVERPIVFDKNRGWPEQVQAIKNFIEPEPRIVATVRPIAEIVASYITLCKKDKDNWIDRHIKADKQPVNNENRATLIWQRYLATTHGLFTEALQLYPENILVVQYDDLMHNPHGTLKRIYRFCGLEHFEHSTNNITPLVPEEKDEEWGAKGLHTIRPKLNRKSVAPSVYLSDEIIATLSQFDITEQSWHANL